MSVHHFSDPITGRWFREIKYKSFKTLDELRLAYEDRGAKTWLEHRDGDSWALTILL